MIGTAFGAGIAATMVAMTWNRQLEGAVGGIGRAWLIVMLVPVIGHLLTLLDPRTSRDAAMFVTFGSAIAALIALFTGQVAYALPLWTVTLMGIFIQAAALTRPSGAARTIVQISRATPSWWRIEGRNAGDPRSSTT